MPGTALRAHVADDHDRSPGSILPSSMAVHERGLVVEAPWPGPRCTSICGQHGRFLDHGAPRGQVAEQHGQAAGGAVGPVERPDDLLVADRRPPRTASAMSTPATVGTEPSTRPASASRFSTAMTPPARCRSSMWLRARGRQLDQVGRAVGDLVEGLQLEVDLGLVGDGHEVQHRVGGAAQGRVDGQRVAEAGGGEEAAGRPALAAPPPPPRRRSAGPGSAGPRTAPGWWRRRAGSGRGSR